MFIEYSRRKSAPSPVTGDATFRVRQLSTGRRQGRTDLSHLIDLSYNYQSPRELRWHLADRLGLSPTSVSLREAS